MKINFIDVGSIGRIPSQWKYKDIDVLLAFDPFEDRINSNKTYYYKKAVFDIESLRKFYKCKKTQCSSLLSPDMDFIKKSYIQHGRPIPERYEVEAVLEVECVRLDTVIDELQVDFDFIKIDVQGAEYHVLQSMGDYLDDLVGIHTESYYAPVYQGYTSFKTVNHFLNNKGFELIKHLRKPNPLFGDFLYLKKDTDKISKRKFIKAMYK